MSELIQYQRDDGIVTLTLNSPETRNPISDDDMIEALLAALERLETDPDAQVAILTGAGSAFSSGGNVKKMGAAGGLNDARPAKTRLNYKQGIQRIPLAFEKLEVPVIAAVNGPAVGAGCDLACMCDLRIAGESAWFAESFVKRASSPATAAPGCCSGWWAFPRRRRWRSPATASKRTKRWPAAWCPGWCRTTSFSTKPAPWRNASP